MQELIAHLQTARRGMWRHRWLGVAAAWLVAAIGSLVVFNIPDQYEASARIHVDTQSILKPLLSGLAVQPDVEQQVNMLGRTLISRPNVEKLVRMADLDLKNRTRSQQDETVDGLMKALRISSTGRDNLYVLSYRDAEPERAKRAVQSLVTIFVESGLGANRQDATAAKTFINDQIKSYQQKLEEAEGRLKEFRLRNIDLQLSDGRDATARIGEMSNQLEKARLELREAENARDAAKVELANSKKPNNASALPNLLQDNTGAPIATPEIDARIDAQRRNLDAMLQRFTEQHPDVTSARRLIKDLEDQRQKEIDERRKAAASAPRSAANAATPGNLAEQELSRMVAISEVQVASLRARVAEYQSRYAQARNQLKTNPQIEAELAQLNRDYAIHKKNYEDLVSRRESAAISGDLDSAAGAVDFRLIDPPRVSPRPVSPNRMLLLPLVLLAALVAGAAITFVASELRPVFFNLGDLRAKVGVPVLGVISEVVGPAKAKARRGELWRFAGAAGSLFLLYGAGVAAMTVLGKS
jgi:polysaccharide chain length determinant protein (PEP-CTERM system associated)